MAQSLRSDLLSCLPAEIGVMILQYGDNLHELSNICCVSLRMYYVYVANKSPILKAILANAIEKKELHESKQDGDTQRVKCAWGWGREWDHIWIPMWAQMLSNSIIDKALNFEQAISILGCSVTTRPQIAYLGEWAKRRFGVASTRQDIFAISICRTSRRRQWENHEKDVQNIYGNLLDFSKLHRTNKIWRPNPHHSAKVSEFMQPKLRELLNRKVREKATLISEISKLEFDHEVSFNPLSIDDPEFWEKWQSIGGCGWTQSELENLNSEIIGLQEELRNYRQDCSKEEKTRQQ